MVSGGPAADGHQAPRVGAVGQGRARAAWGSRTAPLLSVTVSIPLEPDRLRLGLDWVQSPQALKRHDPGAIGFFFDHGGVGEGDWLPVSIAKGNGVSNGERGRPTLGRNAFCSSDGTPFFLASPPCVPVENEKGSHRCKPLKLMVARDGIEPPTRGFSVPCSTN
jgi:hypothetical protein